jgi:Tol biopolymer transport system component
VKELISLPELSEKRNYETGQEVIKGATPQVQPRTSRSPALIGGIVAAGVLGCIVVAVAWRSLSQTELFSPSTIVSTVVSETLIPSSIPKSLIPSSISDTPLPVSAPANIPLPEGYDLAFVSDRDNELENTRVYIVNTDRPTEFQIFENPSGYERAEWPSFCGSQLAAQVVDMDRSNPQWIYFFTLQTSPVKWSDPADALESPRCSPDGRYMAYSVQKGEYWDLAVVEINDGSVIYNPDFRQTGKKSGYVSWLENSQSFIFEIVLPNLKFIRVDNFSFSPTSSEIVATDKNLAHATFSPDGTKAAYACFRGQICVMDLKQGKTSRSIYQTRWNVDVDWAERGAPVWSADGQWIYFPTIDGGDWDIFRIHPDGSNAENVTRDWPSNEMYPAVRW